MVARGKDGVERECIPTAERGKFIVVGTQTVLTTTDPDALVEFWPDETGSD